MKTTEIMNAATRSLNRIGFQFKKHSPEILVVAGIVGVVTSAVMACKATTKVEGVMNDLDKNIEMVNDTLNHPNVTEEQYSEEDAKQDIIKFRVKAGFELVKLYAPAVGLGALSIASILASNNILRKRNLAIAAAYATVDSGFKEYRSRVVERFGKEMDRELKYNIKAETVQETVVDENGEEKTVEKVVEVAHPNIYSDYARCYAEGCKGYTKDPEMNLMYLKQIQNWANDRLQRVGHVYLNEVYDMLGVPRSRAGQIVGWIYDTENVHGDNYIDFGIYDICKEGCRDFVNGRERNIWLDFNVDGVIINDVKHYMDMQ
jgi:hypothetical protein